jgi:hypothetical protein
MTKLTPQDSRWPAVGPDALIVPRRHDPQLARECQGFLGRGGMRLDAGVHFDAVTPPALHGDRTIGAGIDADRSTAGERHDPHFAMLDSRFVPVLTALRQPASVGGTLGGQHRHGQGSEDGNGGEHARHHGSSRHG